MELTADIILLNGRIYTVNKQHPWTEAVACRNGYIIAVGPSSYIKNFASKSTTVINLHGKFAMPGFNDAHVDFYRGAVSLSSVDLRDAKDEQDFAQRIKNYVLKMPPGTWVLEGNWNHENWKSQRFPNKELIDPVSSKHPVLVNRLDEHVSLANSLALKLAGITKDTPNPAGGEIKKNPSTGEPTGILIDTAQELVTRMVPEPSIEQASEKIKNALSYAATFGITSIQDNTSTTTFKVYQELVRKNELTVRVNAWRPVSILDKFVNIGIQQHFGDGMLRLGVIKIFADGSMGAGSALMAAPYSDDSSSCGLAIYEQDELAALIQNIDAAGLQCAVHAIGDKANHLVLNGFEQAKLKNPARHTRHRIEHAQIIHPKDLQRFKDLDIIVSVQPSHCVDDMLWAHNRIGDKRIQYAFLWQSFLKQGCNIAFGTDWPVAPLNPMVTLYAAVARRSLQGEPAEGWFPEEKLSLEQAIECYTHGAAYAEFEENMKGTIEPGKYADIIILSENPFEINHQQLLNVEVVTTIQNGRIVYSKDKL